MAVAATRQSSNSAGHTRAVAVTVSAGGTGSWGFQGGAASPCQAAVFNTASAWLRTGNGS